jgi:hypothetical protein
MYSPSLVLPFCNKLFTGVLKYPREQPIFHASAIRAVGGILFQDEFLTKYAHNFDQKGG